MIRALSDVNGGKDWGQRWGVWGQETTVQRRTAATERQDERDGTCSFYNRSTGREHKGEIREAGRTETAKRGPGGGQEAAEAGAGLRLVPSGLAPTATGADRSDLI